MNRIKFLPALLLAATLHAQQKPILLWPQGTPEHTPILPTKDVSNATLVGGRSLIRLTGVTNPTLTLYPAPAATSTGAAAIVFPGGGYQVLATDLEGDEVCTWLNTLGVTCAVVTYRVPRKLRYPDSTEDLEDAQQAMRLMRSRAAEWHVDPHRIGVVGFSAGAHLAIVLSAHSGQATPGTPPEAPSARPDFAIIAYPGYVAEGPALDRFSPALGSIAEAPPTFIVQAEDDPVHVENAVLYFSALKSAKVPAELHIYAEGGHGYGLRRTEKPVTHWSDLAATWLQTIHMTGKQP